MALENTFLESNSSKKSINTTLIDNFLISQQFILDKCLNHFRLFDILVKPIAHKR